MKLHDRTPFWGPLAAILDFAGGAALQAVSDYTQHREADIFTILIASHVAESVALMIRIQR